MGALVITGILGASALGADKPTPKARRVIEPFDYHGVTLDGSLRRQFDEVRDYYLRIPNDDLLKPYRERAGKPAPGADLGGVYVSHNPFGQFVSGFARMYAATGDIRYKNKAIVLMKGWAECIEPDGFFFVERNPQLIPYYYEKILGGLLDIYHYCDEPKALEHLRRITAWVDKNMSRVRLYANPVTNDGGEWYTLSENLYRAYLYSGDPKYKELGGIYEYKEYWDFFAKKGDIFTRPGWYHAYSHVNTFNGLATAYLVKGDPYYLNTLKSAYDYLQENQCWATGGYGPNEALLPRKDMIRMLTDSENHFETQCGSWAGFKMTKYLIGFTGDARYGDWTEKLLLNGIGASIPMDAKGEVFYYSGYNLGGAEKKLITAAWPCCSGTRPEAVTDYHDLIYFKDADDLYVNLYAASSVKWGAVTVTQQTLFPESDKVSFTVSVHEPKEFGLKVRVPAWLAGPMKAKINGEPVSLQADGSHWAGLHRTWKDGDKLDLQLPMGFWVSRLDPEKGFPAAIMYGPVTMAVRAMGKENPSGKIDFGKLSDVWIPSEGEPLNFHLASDPGMLLRPFYQYKEGERYFLYLDPSWVYVHKSYKDAKYSDGWVNFGDWMTATTPGMSAQYEFEGTGIRVTAYKYDDAGRFEVTIDGAAVGTIDEYGPDRGEQFIWEHKGLNQGKHTIKFTLLPEKSPESKGLYANIGGFEAIDAKS